MQRQRLTRYWAAAVLAVAAAPTGQAVEVRLERRGVSLPAAGELVVTSDALEEPLAFPLAEKLDVATPLPATITCRGTGLWCPEVVLVEEGTALPVYPAVEVVGRLTGPAATAGLRTGSVQGVVRDGVGPRALEFRRELGFDQNVVRFEAPRVPLDLRFAFPGAAPVYRWSVAPPAPGEASVVELGALRLEAGASMSGWLLTEAAESPVAGAIIEAMPAGDAGPPGSPLRESETRSNARGFFQLHGLDPGTYRLEVQAEGFAKRVFEVVELPEAAERLLGTIHLSPPVELSVGVDPPRHPNGGAWTLSIRPVHARPGEPARQVAVDPSGVARVEVDEPGEHHLQIFGPDREALHYEVRELTRDQWVHVEVPVVAVRGGVRLGGEPLAARVTLQGGAGDRSDLASDDEGNLSGWMRRPERPWLMADVAWDEAGREKRRTVEVVPEIGDDVVEIAIELPAGVISGEVVDPEGVPQVGVRVVATPEEDASSYTEVQTRTDSSGRFHLTGLAAGGYLVQAGGNGGSASEVVPVELIAGLPFGNAHLVLWPTRPVTLVLTVGGQPAMGATVGLVGLGRTPVSFGTTTDAEGKAVVALPEAVERVVATLFDPSRWLWSGCVGIEEGVLRLDLPVVQPGSLRLESAFRTDLPALLGSGPVLWTGSGGFVSKNVLANWARQRGGGPRLERDEERAVEVLDVPALAPGSYGVGWSGVPEWELAARACSGAVPEGERITVPAGGEAEVEIDVSRRQERRLEELRRRSRR